MNVMNRISELDILAKIAIINFSVILFYVFLTCFFIPNILFENDPLYTISLTNPNYTHINMLSIFSTAIFGSLVAFLIRKREFDREIKIIKSVLSNSEKEVIKILEKIDEITQDSLRYRLDWSKSKVSTILTNLEKRDIIQRKRDGKTYFIFLVKKKRF